MTFRVGQKVVCVNIAGLTDGGFAGAYLPSALSVGAIYEIRSIGMFKDREVIRLTGITRNNPEPTYRDTPFYSSRFRPLATKSTAAGMAVLREILDRETITEPVKKPSKVH